MKIFFVLIMNWTLVTLAYGEEPSTFSLNQHGVDWLLEQINAQKSNTFIWGQHLMATLSQDGYSQSLLGGVVTNPKANLEEYYCDDTTESDPKCRQIPFVLVYEFKKGSDKIYFNVEGDVTVRLQNGEMSEPRILLMGTTRDITLLKNHFAPFLSEE